MSDGVDQEHADHYLLDDLVSEELRVGQRPVHVFDYQLMHVHQLGIVLADDLFDAVDLRQLYILLPLIFEDGVRAVVLEGLVLEQYPPDLGSHAGAYPVPAVVLELFEILLAVYIGLTFYFALLLQVVLHLVAHWLERFLLLKIRDHFRIQTVFLIMARFLLFSLFV